MATSLNPWRGRSSLETVARMGLGLLGGLNLMSGLHDEDTQPYAEIGGNHVHQAKPGDQFPPVNVHLELKQVHKNIKAWFKQRLLIMLKE